MKINILYILLLFTLIACTEKAKEENNTVNKPSETHIKPAKFIKSAHYFASSWPITFWQEFEQNKVATDLQQIKDDGFNTIILVLPWIGFELNFENEKTTRNPVMYQRLAFLLEQIKQKDFDYILRLGFPHNFAPNLGLTANDLCTRMYEDSNQHQKWIDYLQNVKNVTNDYQDNLSGILISWEDFWCPHLTFPYEEEDRRLQLAKNTGYAQWLLKKDNTLLKIILGSNELKASNIAIPKKDDMHYYLYMEYIDEQFDKLLLSTARTVFPQVAMEIRIDKAPVTSASGEKIWVGHDLQFDEPNHRGTYWAPFWGAENNGEKLTIEQALFNFEYFLNYVTDNGKSTNHVIEQFNFTDNTPYFLHNATMHDKDIESFLIQTIPLLKKYTTGYGVWSYRDYADNALYNASFEMGLDGWEHSGVNIVGDSGDSQIQIRKGGIISQTFKSNHRFLLARTYKEINLCLSSETEGKVALLANDVIEETLKLKPGNNCFKFKADNFVKKFIQFKLIAKTDLIIDEIKLYGFVQILDVYDEFNQPGPNLKAVQEINARLPNEVE